MEESAFTPVIIRGGIIVDPTIDPVFGLEPVFAVTLKTPDLQFFPTAEGFYDYAKDQYIYQYKDHLGNARISFGRNSAGALEITDINNYYPFGLNHIGGFKATIGGYHDYKYNGKELQETGMYDYGARFYMPDIGRFNRPDRFSEKYVNLSNYGYAAGNPIRYIDIKGDSLWIRNKSENILFQNGNLYNKDGTAYRGDGVKVRKDGSIKLKGFLKSAVNALNNLRSGDAGNSVVSELQDSDENYTIVKSSGGNSYSRTNNEVNFDPNSTDGGINEKGSTYRPTFVGLGHEIAHAVDDDRGTLSLSIDPSFGFRDTEKFATHIENQIRSEHGISLRAYYGQNSSGNWVGPLLNNYGPHRESKYYPNYYYGGPNTPFTRPVMPLPITIPNITPTVFNP